MTLDRPDELKEAVKLFEESEKSDSHTKKVNNFRDAINLLNEYVEENPSSPHINFLENIRTSHARLLLEQLSGIQEIGIEDWFNYFTLISFKLESERTRILSENPNLKKGYQGFLALWRDEVLEDLATLPNNE